MTLTRWAIVGALLAVACAGKKTEPASSPAAPARPSTPSPEEPATPEPEPTPAASAEPKAEPAPEGPKAEQPGWASIRDLSPDRRVQLANGFYFVDGIVSRLPCNACSKPLCKPGEQCDRTKSCSYCNATVLIDDGTGQDISIDHEDRDNLPRYRLNERVRIVLEKKGLLRWFVRKSKPCPPSECLETEPAQRLERAPKGVEIRRDGERCYAPQKCPPNAKCDPDQERRVRCP